MLNTPADAPLLHDSSADSPRSSGDSYDSSEAVDERALVSPGIFIWVLTFCAGVSGLLFGYE
jgi:SP family myo-inositol transporter-like MFS transporter 13